MRSLGRSLQLLGLVLLPVGSFFGLEGGPHAMTMMIAFASAGVVVFWVGLRLQRGGGGP